VVEGRRLEMRTPAFAEGNPGVGAHGDEVHRLRNLPFRLARQLAHKDVAQLVRENLGEVAEVGAV